MADITRSMQQEDEDEWEYEYSTTETETYYLTLDFPVQNFPQRHKEIAHNTRGGYRVWYNPNYNEDQNGSDGDADSSRQQTEPREHGETAETADPSNEQIVRPDADLDKMQVLELHSERPLVSYRGMAFRGAWAENIGTELIFADDSPDTPALRHLADGLDLLAASSSRVNLTHVELQPRKRARRAAEIELQPERYRNNGGVYVHVHSDKYGVRRPQADFLEDLTALKRRRGETDEVTITSTETPHNQLLGHDFDEQVHRNRVEKDRARRTRRRAEGSESPSKTADPNYRRKRARRGDPGC